MNRSRQILYFAAWVLNDASIMTGMVHVPRWTWFLNLFVASIIYLVRRRLVNERAELALRTEA